MVFEKPMLEFVAVIPTDAITTSGTGGVDSCNGPTSQSRNCNYFNLAMLDLCGYYDKTDKDESIP